MSNERIRPTETFLLTLGLMIGVGGEKQRNRTVKCGVGVCVTNRTQFDMRSLERHCGECNTGMKATCAILIQIQGEAGHTYQDLDCRGAQVEEIIWQSL